MTLELEDIQVECIIGELPEERVKKQILHVSIVLEIEETASVTDRLEDTLDYCSLIEKTRWNLEEAKCRMIEKAAKTVTDTCLAFPQVKSVEVEIRKEGSMRGLKSAKARMKTVAKQGFLV